MAEATFARIRKMLEPMAARTGDRRLKVACCELVLDSGDGAHALRALAQIRAVDYHIGTIEDARRQLSRQLASMGL